MDEAEVGKIADRRGIQRMVASSGDFFHSIKGKIFILFAVTFLSIGVLAGLNYWSLSTVSQRLLLGEKYDDLLNNTRFQVQSATPSPWVLASSKKTS